MKIKTIQSIIFLIMSIQLANACSCDLPKNSWVSINSYELVIATKIIKQEKPFKYLKRTRHEYTILLVTKIYKGSLKSDTLVYKNGNCNLCGRTLGEYPVGKELFLKLEPFMYYPGWVDEAYQNDTIVENGCCDFNALAIKSNKVILQFQNYKTREMERTKFDKKVLRILKRKKRSLLR